MRSVFNKENDDESLFSSSLPRRAKLSRRTSGALQGRYADPEIQVTAQTREGQSLLGLGPEAEPENLQRRFPREKKQLRF